MKTYETQIEDQCFENAADRRDRYMPQRLYPRQGAPVLLRGQAKGNGTGAERQRERDRYLRDWERRKREWTK